MRLDRLITLNFVQPFHRALDAVAIRASKARKAAIVPILMYHSITDEREPGVDPYYKVNTTPASFRAQMRLLSESGYTPIGVSALLDLLQSGCDCRGNGAPQKISRQDSPVVITFDDGLRNFYNAAFPVLREFGFPATIYLPTSFIGDSPRQFCPFSRPGRSSKNRSASACLTWAEVRELHCEGIEIGSHTVTHPELIHLQWPAIRKELADSKAEIERQLQAPCSHFCYPYAFPARDRDFKTRFTATLRETGYSSCATTQIGRVSSHADRFELRRLPVNSLDDCELLKAKLNGAYDWLSGPQAIVKFVKALGRL